MTTTLYWRNLPACCLLLAVALYAQDAISIAGKITDAKGVPIPAATVRVLAGDQSVAAEMLTDEDGAFGFKGLAGVFQLVVEMTGFQKATRDSVDSSIEASRSLVLVLPSIPRAIPRPVAGRGAGGARPAESGASFQAAEVTDLPGMVMFQQNTIQTGTEETIPSTRTNDLLLINGNSASLDAGDINDPNFRQRMMDSARQMGFQLEMNPFGVPGGEGGRLGGAGGMEGGGLGGRGGGGRGGGAGFAMAGGRGRGVLMQQPKIQGNVSETYSNSALNAQSYSLTGQPVPKPVQIQNNYNITLGGVIPWIKYSTTNARGGRGGGGGGRGGGGRGGQPGWTFTYGGSRNRTPFEALSTVPTDLERAGNFSQSSLQSGPLAGVPVQLYDPLSPTPSLFPGAVIPSGRMDPVSLELLKYVPPANLPGSVQNYYYSRGLVNTSDQFQGSVSGIRLTSKDNVAFNYSYRRGGSTTSQIFPGLDSERSNRGHNLAISGNHSFTARMFGNWRVTLNRTKTESTNGFAYNNNVAGNLGITGISREPINYGIPNINFTNYGDLSLSSPSLNRNQTFTIAAGLNKIGTRHGLQIGGDVGWNQRNQRTDSNARGTFSFTGYTTSAFDAEGRPVAGTGNDFADFLLGLPYSTSRRYGSSNNYLRNRTFSLFVQDNWRLRSNLTLNLGVRYEYTGPTFEKYNHLVSLDVAPDFSAVAQVFPDQVGPLSGQYFPRSLVNADRNNIGPRIGIAWKPTTRSIFVLRAGYGIFYNASAYSSIIGQLVGQPPFAVNQDLLTNLSSPLTLQHGFPVDPEVTILNTYAIDPNYRPAYVQQWNLAVQTQITRLYVLDVSYNGSKGTGLDILRAPNRAPASGVTSVGSISNAGNFVYQSNGACSILHALNVSLVRRFSRGLQVQGSYVLSKSIDGASGIGGGLTVVQNDANIAAERALSSFDQRHNFTTTFNFELPIGQNRRFFANASAKVLNFIAGWSINGSFNLASGSPLTARMLGNVSNNSGTATGANNSERPDATGVQVGLPWGDRTTAQFFNPLAFSIPEPGTFGNAGRGTITGPGSNLLNLALRKSFRLDDNNRRIDFNWQVSNALNHPNFGGVGTTINALNFGRVTSVRSMRSMSMNLRISF